MAEFTNRAAYLKGLADGMKLDTEKNEGKLLSEIIDFLCDISAEIEALDDEQGFIADQIDELEEEVELIGDEMFEDYDDEDDEEFEICCEACGKDILISAEDLMDGEIICPYCGEVIEFEFDCDCDCEDCNCDDCE
jgi:predicted nuclease with TOPRIM domain